MPLTLADLEPKWRERIQAHLRGQDADGQNVSRITTLIIELRDEAVNGRKESGIEDIWYEAERSYAGIDDANAGEYPNSRWSKPMSADGPLTQDVRRDPNEQPKSTVFLNITDRYVTAATAKVVEILIPSDDKPYAIEPTPIPELADGKDDNSPIRMDDIPGSPVATRPLRADEIQNPSPAAVAAAPAISLPGPPMTPQPGAVPAAPGGPAVAPGAAVAEPPRVPVRVRDAAEEKESLAEKRAKKAEKRVDDWLTEAKYTAHKRAAIHDCARLGVGVLKGPFLETRSARVIEGLDAEGENGDNIAFTMVQKTVPSVKWIDPWNCFPDPACGENTDDGDNFTELALLTKKGMRKLKGQPGYDWKAIDLCLDEGPGKTSHESESAERGDPKVVATNTSKKFEAWYVHCNIEKADLECLYRASGQELKLTNREKRHKTLPIIATMVNDRLIKCAINPFDTGRFPYRCVPWQRRAGHWAGKGVAEQLKAPQRIVNGAVRAMMDNAGISAGGQIVINREALEPADGKWNIVPNKIWWRTADGAEMPVQDLFATFDIPNKTVELQIILHEGQRQAEEVTSIPLVTQGQSGSTTPETYGATQLQNNNANQMLRLLAGHWDIYETVPLLDMCYEHLLLDPDVPSDEKGDFQIKARGSAILVERAITQQFLVQIGGIVKDPESELSYARWCEELLRANHVDPERLRLTEEEKQERASRQPPKMPQVQVAEIKAATDEKRLALEQQRAQQEGTQAQAQLTLDQQDVESDRIVALQKIKAESEGRVAQLEAENNKMKVDLAKMTMQLQTQRDLARQANAAKATAERKGKEGDRQNRRLRRQNGPVVPQVAPAPTEPPGLAPNGTAFQA